MLVNIFDGVWNNGYLMSGGRNLIVGSSNGDIRQWKGYGWLGKLYQYSEEHTHIKLPLCMAGIAAIILI